MREEMNLNKVVFRFVQPFVDLNNMLRDFSQFIMWKSRLHGHFDRLVAVGTHGKFTELADGSAQFVGEFIEDNH